MVVFLLLRPTAKFPFSSFMPPWLSWYTRFFIFLPCFFIRWNQSVSKKFRLTPTSYETVFVSSLFFFPISFSAIWSKKARRSICPPRSLHHWFFDACRPFWDVRKIECAKLIKNKIYLWNVLVHQNSGEYFVEKYHEEISFFPLQTAHNYDMICCRLWWYWKF